MTASTSLKALRPWPTGVHLQIAQQLARQALMDVSRPPPAVSERFWGRVQRGAPEHCWPWGGSRRGGYGFCRIPEWGTSIGAHRVALWDEAGVLGNARAGHVTRHLCHNKSCCNPTHLLIGCAGENKWDDWLRSLGVDLVAVRSEVERDFRLELDAVRLGELRRGWSRKISRLAEARLAA
jgi:hypothetical protein